MTRSAGQEVGAVRRLFQPGGPIYALASLLPEARPVPGGAPAFLLLSAYCLSLAPFCMPYHLIWSHSSICTQATQPTGQQAQRCDPCALQSLSQSPPPTPSIHTCPIPALLYLTHEKWGRRMRSEGGGPCTWSPSHFQSGSVAGSPPQISDFIL